MKKAIHWLHVMFTSRITSDRLDLAMTQLLCIATAPALLMFSWRAVAVHATTTGEVVVGILGSVSASLLFVVIGLLLPLASPAWRDGPSERIMDGPS